MKGSFYRRELKAPAIAFSSAEGRQIFQEALASGHLEAYFNIAEQFNTQTHPSFCGIGSLSMSLNALLVDPHRVWQGVWRWFDDSMLDCCTSLEIVRGKGITMPQLACIAKCNGANVDLVYSEQTDEETFRQTIKAATSSSFQDGGGKVIIASYFRGKLNQTGTGHFSPVGGYHPERDLVLIMDVARFKYPPHWVPLHDLFEAMKDVDPDTNLSRGYLVLSNSADSKGEQLASKCKTFCDSIACQVIQTAAQDNSEVKIVVTESASNSNIYNEISDTIDTSSDSDPASLKHMVTISRNQVTQIEAIIESRCPKCHCTQSLDL